MPGAIVAAPKHPCQQKRATTHGERVTWARLGYAASAIMAAEHAVLYQYSLRTIDDGGEMYRSVLVATDGSETAAEAVRVAINLAKTFGARLHIATVHRPEVSARAWSDAKVSYREEHDPAGVAATQTESMAVQARAEGVPTQTHVVTGFVAERIVSIAKEHDVELIVVGNKGMRGLKRVLGSVPNAVAHSAPCAVLIVNTT